MATASKSNAVRTTGNTWTALATGAQVVTSVTVTPAANTSVSLMMRRGGIDYMIQSPTDISASSRIRTDAIAMEAGDVLMARSAVQADWVTSGYVEV